jgi:hypothetical protein
VARRDWGQQRYGRMNEISDSRREVFHRDHLSLRRNRAAACRIV